MVVPPATLLVVASLSGWIQDAPETLGGWTYGFAALMAFLEFSSLAGVPVPFEVGVVLSGAVAGEGEIAPPPLIMLVWLAAAAGESVNFATGDRFGRPFLERHGARFRVTPARLAWIDERFEHRGRLFVLIGRFIPFVRSSMPFVAGASQMAYRSFLLWSVGGNLLWAAVFCGVGYGFYESADQVADVVQRVGVLVFVALVAAGALVGYLRRRRGVQKRGNALDPLADPLRQLDEDPLRAADVAEPVPVLVALQLAHELGAAGSQAGNDGVDVLHGE